MQPEHRVPPRNGLGNGSIADVVGNKADTAAGASIYSKLVDLVTKIGSVLTSLTLPAVDSANNATLADVIGSKSDTILGDSVFSHVYTVERHLHNRCRVYPTLADGVLVQAGAQAWVLGNYAVIVPAGAIDDVFDIHGIDFDIISGNTPNELVLYYGPDGSELEAGRIRFCSNGVGNAIISEAAFQTRKLPAGSQIKAKLANKNPLEFVNMSIRYHKY